MLLREENDTFFCNTSCPQHGQTHVKNLAVFGARFGLMWVIILLPLGLGFMGFFKKFEINPFLLALLIKKISNSKWSSFLKLNFCKNKRKRKNKIKVTKFFEFYFYFRIYLADDYLWKLNILQGVFVTYWWSIFAKIVNGF